MYLYVYVGNELLLQLDLVRLSYRRTAPINVPRSGFPNIPSGSMGSQNGCISARSPHSYRKHSREFDDAVGIWGAGAILVRIWELCSVSAPVFVSVSVYFPEWYVCEARGVAFIVDSRSRG